MTGKIIIDGKEFPLRYGMGALRALWDILGVSLPEEVQAARIIYAAHVCYCESRQIPPSLEYWQVVDFVEAGLFDPESKDNEQIAKALAGYNESNIIKGAIKKINEQLDEQEEEDKKKVSSPTMNGLPTESSNLNHGSLSG